MNSYSDDGSKWCVPIACMYALKAIKFYLFLVKCIHILLMKFITNILTWNSPIFVIWPQKYVAKFHASVPLIPAVLYLVRIRTIFSAVNWSSSPSLIHLTVTKSGHAEWGLEPGMFCYRLYRQWHHPLMEVKRKCAWLTIGLHTIVGLLRRN